MKAGVTISRNSKGVISIAITEESSGIQIVAVEMELSGFAEALTGLAEVESTISRICTASQFQNLGREKEVMRVHCERVYDKAEQRKLVEAEIKNHPGWELWSDGTREQQRANFHQFVICRYVEKEGGAE